MQCLRVFDEFWALKSRLLGGCVATGLEHRAGYLFASGE